MSDSRDPLHDTDAVWDPEQTTPVGDAGSATSSSPHAFPVPGWTRYTEIEFIGAGGMGAVYKAWDPSLKRHVAIKLIGRGDPRRVERFLLEAQAQARVEHDRICKVHEVGEVEGHPFIAMQFIDGRSLNEVASEMTLEQKVVVVQQVAEALHAAHRIGLIHRDIKPANVMVERSDTGAWRPFVVDFGLARELAGDGVTVTGEVIGTPSYMAPEQALGEANRLDRRSDVYGLGATLYWVLVGKPPFEGTGPMETMLQVISDEPLPVRNRASSVPVDLETIVMKCLDKDSNRRYESARALAEDLGRFIDGEPVRARPASITYRIGKKARKHAPMIALGAIGLVIAATLGVMWLRASWNASRQAALAMRLGQTVERVENLLWRARSLEIHDIRPDEQRMRDRLREIEAEIADSGEYAQGPGHAALGRGFLALHDHEQARRHLEKAWDAGYQTPEVAYSLGLALVRQYQSAVLEARSIGDEMRRKSALEEARIAFRDPAHTYLEACDDVEIEAPEYLHAVLAYLDDHEAESLRLARVAVDKHQWLYQGQNLVGRILLERGLSERNDGNYERSTEALLEAQEAFENASRIAPSDSQSYLGSCETRQAVFYDEVWTRGTATAESLASSLEPCLAALQIDAGAAGTHHLVASAYILWAEFQIRRGRVPLHTLEMAAVSAEEALRLAPGDVDALAALSEIHWKRGQHEMNHRGEPIPSLTRAEVYAEEAYRLSMQNGAFADHLAGILLDRGIWEKLTGTDPRQTWEHSIAYFEEAVDSVENNATDALNIGLVCWQWAEYLLEDRGEDPSDISARGLRWLDRSLEFNPRFSYTYRTVGAIHMVLARWAVRQGSSPSSELVAATAALETAVDANPNDPMSSELLASALLMAIEREEGRVSPEAFARVRSVIEKGLELIPEHLNMSLMKERIAELEAAAGAPTGRP